MEEEEEREEEKEEEEKEKEEEVATAILTYYNTHVPCIILLKHEIKLMHISTIIVHTTELRDIFQRGQKSSVKVSIYT